MASSGYEGTIGSETARRFPLLTPEGETASTVAEAKAALELKRRYVRSSISHRRLSPG
jgi:hypothetical protein